MWNVLFGTKIKVCSRQTGRCVEAVVEDRGPAKRLNRRVDLSRRAFEAIADPKQGVIDVTVEVLK